MSSETLNSRPQEQLDTSQVEFEYERNPSWAEHPDDTPDVAQAKAFMRADEERRARETAEMDAMSPLTDTIDPRIAQKAAAETASAERLRTAILTEAPAAVKDLLEVKQSVEDYSDLQSVAETLAGLPMLNQNDLNVDTMSEGLYTEVLEDVSIPMSRIVGIKTFETWAGRGFNDDGKVWEKNRGSSLGEVAKSAELGAPDSYWGRSGAVSVELFQDSDGETWGYVTSEGSHRAAAAKLRGDELLTHATVRTGAELPVANFSVHDRLAEQKAQLEDPEYQAALQAYVSAYVDGSRQLEAKKLESRHAA